MDPDVRGRAKVPLPPALAIPLATARAQTIPACQDFCRRVLVYENRP